MKKTFGSTKQLDQNQQEWLSLLAKAENPLTQPEGTEEFLAIEIEVAELVDIGHCFMKPPEVALVKDTKGRLWIVPETRGEGGLVSRYNAKPGTKLKLVITKQTSYSTQAFVLK